MLKEYEVGQQFANAAHSRQWQITGILLILALGGPFGASWLMGMDKISSDVHLVMVIAVAVFAICLDGLWILAWNRERFYLEITYHRLREIETLLGLRRNLYINILDNPLPSRHLSANEKSHWENERKRFLEKESLQKLKGPPYHGIIRVANVVNAIAFLIFLFWLFVVFLQFKHCFG